MPTFAMLQDRLLARVNHAIRNGEMTERGLARAIASSQPHVHNFLCGRRGMSFETADMLFAHLRTNAYDLLELREVLELEERRGGPLSVRRCAGCAVATVAKSG